MAMSMRRGLVIAAVAAAVVAGGAVLWLERIPAVTDAIELKPPSAAELQAFAGTKVLFGHQSVGANIISGVAPLFADAGQAPPRIVEVREPVLSEGGVLAHTHIGVNGDPFGKFADFTAVLGAGLAEQLDVAVLKLCYADVVSSTDVDAVFRAYVATMTELEQRYPDLVLVYATVPLTTDRSWKAVLKSWAGIDDQMGPADNLARQRYNALIREKYASTGRLFDIAAIEATSRQVSTTRESGESTFFVLNPALSSDAGHLNELGGKAAAAELVRVVAGVSP